MIVYLAYACQIKVKSPLLPIFCNWVQSAADMSNELFIHLLFTSCPLNGNTIKWVIYTSWIFILEELMRSITISTRRTETRVTLSQWMDKSSAILG